MIVSRPLLLLASVACCWLLAQRQAAEAASSPTVYLPSSMRNEGRIILTYGQGEQITQHHLSFSEAIDSQTRRSRISIGYISYKPTVYTTWPNAPTITTDASGLCIRANAKDVAFLPELDWFVRMIWTDDEISRFLTNEPHMVGPSGLVLMMLRTKGPKKSVMDRIETHRNVPCKVYTMRYDRAKSEGVEFEIYIPENAIFDDPKLPFFTARELTRKVEVDGQQFDVSFTIDFFSIETVDEDQHKRRQLEREFNMPLASSCSRILPQLEPKFAQDQTSFVMSYYQLSVLSLTSLAYDHERNYLRKEVFEQTVDVWDLNHDILYHIDPRASGKLRNSPSIDATPCSVLNVFDDKLGQFFRPFRVVQESLDVTDFLGARQLAYVGVGMVRELPCAIFETVLFEPPMVFAATALGRLQRLAKHNYIVQYYLLRTDPTQVFVSSEFSQSSRLDAQNFWPIRVTLYRVTLETNERQLVDQLDVTDFHWGLLGAAKKPSELFMVRECFDDEDEQTRVEMALDFKFRSDLDRKLLAHNKFRLEYDLSRELVELLRVARTNIVDFQLSFRPHDLVLEMTLADRAEDKSLIYYGEGELPEKYSYANNRLVLLGLTEEQCVATVSLIDDISFVVYCPMKAAPDVESSCTAVYSETEPAIKAPPSTGDGAAAPTPDESSCQIYRFAPAVPLKKVTNELEKRKQEFWAHTFHITVDSPITSSRIAFAGEVVGLDISRQTQLLTIYHYSFVAPDDDADDDAAQQADKEADQKRKPPVRQFKSLSYRNVGDCEKICNLDSSCKSYSYCAAPANKRLASPTCILSSLELRDSKVTEQLVAKQTVNEELEVNNVDGTPYKLRLSSSCNIHERDYLSSFKLTEEVVRVDKSLLDQFKSEPSVFECARQAVEAEEKFPDHYATLFAYCSYSNTCLFNENLFAKLGDNAAGGDSSLPDEDDVEQSDKDEVQCSVYRRKYQSYFKISPRVFKREPLKQVELAFSTVEECARACWTQFGQVCGSFDFCSPGSCLINDASQLDHSIWDEFEVRNDCLHYDRDLTLDKLRIEHLIGKHQVLDSSLQPGAGGWSTFGKFLLNILLFCFVSSSFLVGLVVGRQVNDRFEHLTIVRQSFSAGSSGLRRMSQAFGFTRFYGGATDEQRRSFASDDQFKGDNGGDDSFGGGYYGGSTAIQMEEIKKNGTIQEEDETGAADSSSESAASKQPTVSDDTYETVDVDQLDSPATGNHVAEQPKSEENLFEF